MAEMRHWNRLATQDAKTETEKCLHCGAELQKPRKLKDLCSYAHRDRGAHTVKAFNGPG
jgi:hypothetical protein